MEWAHDLESFGWCHGETIESMQPAESQTQGRWNVHIGQVLNFLGQPTIVRVQQHVLCTLGCRNFKWPIHRVMPFLVLEILGCIEATCVQYDILP